MKFKALARSIVAVACCATAFADPPATTRPVRDPTEPEPALAQVLGGSGAAARPFVRRLPKVTRLGLVVAAGKPAEALIEVVGSGTFFVHEGSTLTVTTDGVNTVLRVTHLSSDTMEISFDSQNATMIVR